jgi:ribosome-associated toxin RatA of RatAB toxin-antitoxin module
MTIFPRRHLASAAICLGFASLLAPLAALAEGNDAEAQRLAQKRAAARYSVEVPGASLRAGGAAIFVDAPMPVVRKVVTEYSKYASFIPRFQKSKVISKKDGKSDVYLQVPILNGAATVWSLTRFEPPTKEGTNGELIQGKMLEGNVNDLQSWFHLRPVDENHTVLKLELLISLKLPLPGKVVTPELEFASDQAVTAIRDRAETRHKQSPKDASAKRLPRSLAPPRGPLCRKLPALSSTNPQPPTSALHDRPGADLCRPRRLRRAHRFCPHWPHAPPPRWLLGRGALLFSPRTAPTARATLRSGDERSAPPATLPHLRGSHPTAPLAPRRKLPPRHQRSPGPPGACAPRPPGQPPRLRRRPRLRLARPRWPPLPARHRGLQAPAARPRGSVAPALERRPGGVAGWRRNRSAGRV